MKVVLLALLASALALGTCQDFEAFAEIYAPYLRFHHTQGEDGYCFPHNASDYYDVRGSGDPSRQCNLDYQSVKDGLVPTYWHAQICRYMYISYWSFYGYNHKCDLIGGERDAFWESLVIKVRDWDLDPRMHEVRFSQKDGWYTRIPGHYETRDETHPVAYVGKANHGFYHDDGGTNTCCYYEDTRNPGDPNQYMETWLNLVELKNGTEDWMMDPDTSVWGGLQVPTLRPDFDLCNLNGCTGSHVQICGTCGCAKSDIGDEPF
ncbi:uncharacterized protein [Macrobrachium rosenbergii]|uniref:uncharacterized protein n=1 Tax=Macrobrachium rosenbergii TaxID=79674 RepID=UPI0034D3FBFA